MALTFAKVKHGIGLNQRIHIYDVTFDSSYPTGGEAVAASDFGMTSGSINAVTPVFSGATAANGRIVAWNPSTGKLTVWTAPGTEAGNASDQSAVTVRCTVFLERFTGAATS